MSLPGDDATWTIERLGHRGDGIARRGAERALAPLTLPGEVISGTPQRGRIAGARILRPAAERVAPDCPHYAHCGGCALMHASDEFVKRWKVGVVTEALRAQGLAAPVAGIHVSPPFSRRRAVLAGRMGPGGPVVGLHARASAEIVAIGSCRVLRPAINGALPLLGRLVAACAPWTAEMTLSVTETGPGLDVAIAPQPGARRRRGTPPDDAGLFARLSALAAEGDLARLSWADLSITRRPPTLRFGRATVVPPPGAFLQATAEAQAAMTALLRRITAGAPRITELFAGCGTFSLPLAETAEIRAFEGLAAPLAALDTAARRTPGLRRITTATRDLARRPLLADELGGDAIVIDPPRAGAEAQAREIARTKVPVLAYVSCDPASFARDARILAEGGLDLVALWVIDQFRWSPHVETVAEFRRR